MKRILVALCILGLFACSLIADESEFYPVRVEVLKVYSHAEGYKVVYQKGRADFAEVYIPVAWFVPGGKADMIAANGPSYPYMVVYFKNGTFDQQPHRSLEVLDDRVDEIEGFGDVDVGMRGLQCRQGEAHAVGDIDFAGTAGAHDFEADDRLAVEQGRRSLFGDRISHRRQLVEAHPATVREGDFDRAKLFGTADGSDGSHGLFSAADVGAAA